jgi:hypothetical protein
MMDHDAPGARRASDVKGKVIHRFILPDVFTLNVGNVILLLCVAVAHIKKDSRLSPFEVVPNQVRVAP